MTRSPALAGTANTPLLPTVDVIDQLAREEIPAFIAGCAALQALAAARWAAESGAARSQTAFAEDHPREPDLVPVGEAARVLAISTTALRRLETHGEIPSVRVGRRVLFRRATLERFAADRETARH